MATLADVAARAGVSKSTASRVLNGKTDIPVSAATIARIRQAAEEVGYRPNRLAAALATGRTNMIAVLLPVLDRPYYSAIIGNIERIVRAQGYDLLVSCARPASDLSRVFSLPADGVILCELFGIDPSFFSTLASRGRAVVAFSGQHARECDTVTFDMEPAVRDAMQHLIQQGCRRIGYLTVPPTIRDEFPRWAGYREAMLWAGLEPLPILIDAERRNLARDGIMRAIEEHPDLDGLFCHTDHLALGALRGILDAGRRVPEDIAVVGCDGTEECEFAEPPISTIELPIAEMCEAVWSLLQRRLADPSAPLTGTVHPARFVPRLSSIKSDAPSNSPQDGLCTWVSRMKGGDHEN